MKKSLKNVIVSLVAVLAVSAPVYATGESSTFDTGTTAASVTLGPSDDGYVLQGLYAKSDKAASVVKFYGKGGAGKVPVTATATNGATVIYCDNSSYGLTNSDVVVYAYADGDYAQTTISAATTTNVTLAAAITQAGGTSDAIYEMTQGFQIACGATSVSQFGDAVYYTPRKSPLYVVLDGTSACTLSVTAKDQD